MPESPAKGGARRASALSYEGSGAPKVVASGKGIIAERILEAAHAAGVPVRSDPALAEALAKLELDHEIPDELYVVVAEALAWAYGLDARASSRAARLR